MASTLPTLTLYRIDGACSLVVHITLHELAIPFTSTRMVINPTTRKPEAADGSLTSQDYMRTIHPNGQVPALKVQLPSSLSPLSSSSSSSSSPRSNPNSGPELDEGNKEVIITETPAILLYLASLFPERYLAGATTLERAQVTSWLCFLSTSVHGQGYGPLSHPDRYIARGDGGRQYPQAQGDMERAVREAGRRSIEGFYRQVEGRLPACEENKGGQGFFAVSGRLTVVDFYLYLFYRWGRDDLGINMGQLHPRWTALAKKLEGMPSVKTAIWLERAGSSF